MAQQVEQLTRNEQVVRSNRIGSSKNPECFLHSGFLLSHASFNVYILQYTEGEEDECELFAYVYLENGETLYICLAWEFGYPEDFYLSLDGVLYDDATYSVAGKLVGSGNGMQYMGSILVSTDLNEQELYEYYSENFAYIEVYKQEESKLDFIMFDYSFDKFPKNKTNCYSVTCWGSQPKNKIFAWLLDFDLRGH